MQNKHILQQSKLLSLIQNLPIDTEVRTTQTCFPNKIGPVESSRCIM